MFFNIFLSRDGSKMVFGTEKEAEKLLRLTFLYVSLNGF